MWVVVVSVLCIIFGPRLHLHVFTFKYFWDGEMHTCTLMERDRKIERDKKTHRNKDREHWKNKKNEGGEKGEGEKVVGYEKGEKV
jgi:hypothetical protein